MTLAELRESLDASEPPDGLSLELRALWWDAKGDWKQAHDLINDEPGPNAAWVHAYLHRKEGDLSNARYWYGRVGKPECKDTLDAEWAKIARVMMVVP
jgi:hypothetical protein